MSEIASTPTFKKKRERPFLGHAIVDGKIRYTSVSQIKLFSPSSEGCPRKWFYTYKLGQKLARTTSQTGGSGHAEALEHWESTGEDVLGAVLQPAKRYFPAPGSDLACEEPLGDIAKAVALRDALLKSSLLPRAQLIEFLDEIRKAAGLTVAGIPVDGAADVRHTRGEYIDSDGLLKREPAGAVVAEILDLKTTSRIYPHKILKGPSAGTILQSYVKTDAEVCEDIQMLGYARNAVDKYPGMTHIRLSHVYANTTKREAVKRTGLISVEQVLRRWEPVEDIAREMEGVATAERVEDVQPNTGACDSYTHVDPTDPTGKKISKGCGFRYQCPLHITQVVSNMLSPYKESAMSLFDQVANAPAVPVAPQAPLPPPLDDAAHAAAVEAEKVKLRASLSVTAPQVAPVSLGFCPKCGTPLSAENTSKLVSGEVKHIGCAAAVVAAPAVPQSPYAVSPPDQPRAPSLLDAAAPLPAEEIAQITDPALREKVEQHARDHAAREAAEAAAEEAAKVAAGTSVWCPGGSQKVAVSTIMAMEGYQCSCGKKYEGKPWKKIIVKEGDNHFADIPRHKPPKKEGAGELATLTNAIVAAPAIPAVPVVVPSVPTVPAVPTTRTGTNIFITGDDGVKREMTFEEIHGDSPVAPAIPTQTTTAPPAVPVQVAPAVPVAPPIPTNGNGHAKNGSADHVLGSVTSVKVRAAVVFRVGMASGKEISVLAPTMAGALLLAGDYAGEASDEVKSIDKLMGAVIEGA